MGWYYGYGSRASLIAEVTKGWDNPTGKLTCIAKCTTGNNLWTVFERTIKANGDAPERTQRWICLFMIRRAGGDWGYKSVDEEMGPTYYNCPLKYIKLAEEKPAPSEMAYATEWRAAVREHWARMAEGRNVTSTLKQGDAFWSLGKKYAYEGPYSRTEVIGREDITRRQYRIKKTNINLEAPVPA